MDYEKLVKELDTLRSHFDSGFSSIEKTRINQLHILYLGEPVKNLSCNDCYRDALVEIRAYVQKLGRVPDPYDYKLKDGEYLPDGRGINTKPTNKEAEEYLAQYPGAIDRFEKFPSDWETRVEKIKKSANKTDGQEEASKRGRKPKSTTEN